MAEQTTHTLPLREKVPSSDKWHIEDIFADDNAFLAALSACRTHINALSEFKNHLGDSAETLCHYLTEKEKVLVELDSLYCYAGHRSDEDTSNPHYQDLRGQVDFTGNHFYEVTAFEDPELLSLPENFIPDALSTCPDLVPFTHYLENTLRMKAHTLSREEEALLSLTMDLDSTPQSIFYMFNNADIQFESVTDKDGHEVGISHGRFVPLLESPDRDLRRKVFQSYYHSFNQYKNTVAAIFAANLKKELFYTKARHYTSSMEAHLSQNNIPTAVYEQLIEAVHDALPEMYRYVRLRRKMLGVKELHMYDVYVPMIEKTEKKYSFEEAKHMVLNALSVLGSEYTGLLEKGFHERWIDIYENEGKRSGAYSWGAYGTHPYVLLNYQGNLNHVFTLAHEMGHALHSWYSDHAQNYLNAGYRIFVAEVASTCNEALLIHDLMEKTEDKKEKAYLINYFLEQFRTTLYRQTMFAHFEQEMHQKVEQGETLTADVLCDAYYALNQKYYGEAMVSDDLIRYEWARIPHFYTPFYVYQYATGFSAAIAISTKILAKEEGIVEKYKAFLSGGCSMDPIDLLKLCGVDMEKKEPVEEALKVFEQYLTELEKLV